MKKTILAALLLLTISCAKKEAPAAPTLTPSETVLKICDALSRHDSAAYLGMVAAARRQTYAANPMLLSRTLAFWSSSKPTIQVLSESQTDSTAIVKYRLKLVGAQTVYKTDSTELLLEHGAWKYAR
jgi:hypothetical protein